MVAQSIGVPHLGLSEGFGEVSPAVVVEIRSYFVPGVTGDCVSGDYDDVGVDGLDVGGDVLFVTEIALGGFTEVEVGDLEDGEGVVEAESEGFVDDLGEGRGEEEEEREDEEEEEG